MCANRLTYLFLLLQPFIILTGCWPKETSDAKQTYKYWAETDPPADIQLLKGQYQGSMHWTKEYTMYIKFKPSDKWWGDFLDLNTISEDSGSYFNPSDAPTWFTPSNKSIRFRAKNGFDQGSRYYRDTITDVSYIYEIQF
jgi:hypothetical protein